MEIAELRNGFRLGDYEIYPLRGQVLGPGGIDDIEHKVMEVLLLLASRAGVVVTRHEFLDTVWQRSAAGDECLTRCISLLRKALRDSARHPAIIRTVPQVGYELICPIESITPEPEVTVVPNSVARRSKDVLAGEPDHGRRWSGPIRAASCGLLGAWITLQAVDIVLTLSELPRTLTFQVALAAASIAPLASVVIWIVRHSAESSKGRSPLRSVRTVSLVVAAVLWFGFGLVTAYGSMPAADRFDPSANIATQQQAGEAVAQNNYPSAYQGSGACPLPLASVL